MVQRYGTLKIVVPLSLLCFYKQTAWCKRRLSILGEDDLNFAFRLGSKIDTVCRERPIEMRFIDNVALWITLRQVAVNIHCAASAIEARSEEHTSELQS